MQIADTKVSLHSQLKSDFLERNEVHIHALQNAIQKDGLSGGMTSLVSLAFKKPTKQSCENDRQIIMEGKIDEDQRNKRKDIGSKKEGVTDLNISKDNKENVLNLKPYVPEGMTNHSLETFDQVYKILFV